MCRFIATIAAVICFCASTATAQNCANGQCGIAISSPAKEITADGKRLVFSGKFSAAGNPQYYYADDQGDGKFQGKFGKIVNGSVIADAPSAAAKVGGIVKDNPASEPHPCLCGCDVSGVCKCPSCNAGCGFPTAKKEAKK